MPIKHSKDDLPITVGRLLVIDVAVGQRVAVIGTFMNFVPIFDTARQEDTIESFDGRWRRVTILFTKTAINFASRFDDT